MLLSMLPLAAAAVSLLLAVVSLLPRRRSRARWWFFAGMALFGADSLITGLSLRSPDVSEMLDGLTLSFLAKSLAPGPWLVFSFIYSRGDYRESFKRWRVLLTVAALAPVLLAVVFRQELLEIGASDGDTLVLHFGWPATLLNISLLLPHIWVLMNLEQTFRSAVGTMRWRIKLVVLGLAVIFGARIYVRSQGILFSTYDTYWAGVEASGLLVGCCLLVLAYVRTGLAETEVYPSRAVLRSSLTVAIVGVYLFVVGILARIVTYFGGVESFQLQALVVLLGIAGLAVLLLSDRLREHIHGFVSRHFSRAQHDSVRIWTALSRRLANVKDQAGLCTASVRLLSETFDVLSVSVWLLNERSEEFALGASTAPPESQSSTDPLPTALSGDVVTAISTTPGPFDLESVHASWADELRQRNPATFPNGGSRWCVPLRAAEKTYGIIVLADRVNGAAYTLEQLQLLQCIADQITSVLLNLRLAGQVARASELEAFRTMSAFFVHDLKNAASSLNLMLKNLPVHFDDPAFRADALRRYR